MKFQVDYNHSFLGSSDGGSSVVMGATGRLISPEVWVRQPFQILLFLLL